MPMMDSEVDHGYDMIGTDRFVLSPTFNGHSEFLQQDTMLSPSEYAHAWPLGTSVQGVWDLGLDQKQLDGHSE